MKNREADASIHRAAADGDIEALGAALKRDPELVNAPGWMGSTPLHEAASHGQTAAVEELLQYNANTNARRDADITPLHWAGNAAIARMLVAAGAQLEAVDAYGRTPLHHAVNEGHADVVAFLLEQGAQVNVQCTYDGTPLHIAAKRGDVAIARQLLATGAEINANYHDRRPPGWRGDLVLYRHDADSPQWRASIDATVTGDHRSLHKAGHSMGFVGSVLFIGDDYLLCGTTGGLLLAYNTTDGRLAQRISLGTKAAVVALAFDAQGNIWATLDNGRLVTVVWQGAV